MGQKSLEGNIHLFQFDEDTGSREDFSIFYNDALVVIADSDAEYRRARGVIENTISYDSNRDDFDMDFVRENREQLVKDLKDNGFDAFWLSHHNYVSEGY